MNCTVDKTHLKCTFIHIVIIRYKPDRHSSFEIRKVVLRLCKREKNDFPREFRAKTA